MKNTSWSLRVIAALLLAAYFAAWIPQPVEAAPALQSCRFVHVYSRGEPLSVIAHYYGITVQELRAANPWLRYGRLDDGDLLCIPRVSAEVLYPKAVVHARIYLGRVTVWGSGFPYIYRNYTRSVYTVRIRPYRTVSWKKLGTLRPDKDGTFAAHFKLPKNLAKTRYFEVCLKEINRNYTFCTTVDNRWKTGAWNYGGWAP